MNKIVVSLGMAALGASTLHPASAQEAALPSKLWNVTASLRGFYDDNINTSSDKQDAYGYEVSPGVGINWEADATKVRLGYNYSFKYYDHRQEGNSDKYDQVHTFDGVLDHAFNERFRVNVADSFVIGQEPDTIRGGQGPLSSVQYISGDNIRNYGSITFDAQVTRLVGLTVGYDNELFDYADDGDYSNSALYDRIQNGVTLEGNFLVQPETKALAGAKFQQVNYTADELITTVDKSDVKDSRAYIGYVGVDHAFNPDLSGSIRAGIQYSDFYNDPNNNTDYSPYIQANARYTYAPESYASLGFTQSRAASDISGNGANFVRDTDVSLLYGSVRHRITPKLFGTVIGTFQNSMYNGGGSGINGQSRQFYSIGVNGQYRFNPFLAAEAGYNFDDVESDVSGATSYTRNRVYIGLIATY